MESIRVAQRHLHALGITAWQDAWVRPDLLKGYRELDDAGELSTRVVTALWWDRHRGLEQIDELVEQHNWAKGRVNAADDQDHARRLSRERHRLDARALRRALRRGARPRDPVRRGGCARRGGRQARRASGSRSTSTRWGTVRSVRRSTPSRPRARRTDGTTPPSHRAPAAARPRRHPRLRELGVAANIQPVWACPDPMIETLTRPRVGDRAERLYPIGDVVRSGAVLAMGSDWPVSTPERLRGDAGRGDAPGDRRRPRRAGAGRDTADHARRGDRRRSRGGART